MLVFVFQPLTYYLNKMVSRKGQFKKGHKLRLGMKHTKEAKKKMSKARKGKWTKEKNPRWKGGEIKRKCAVCGKEFSVKPSHLKYGAGKYCSRKCKSQSMTGKKLSRETKRKMSLSQGGTRIPLRGTKRYYHMRDKKYMEWRTKVFLRDNFTCQLCQKVGIYLQPHHIKSWAKYKTLRYEVSNGITLCIQCHRLTHTLQSKSYVKTHKLLHKKH